VFRAQTASLGEPAQKLRRDTNAGVVVEGCSRKPGALDQKGAPPMPLDSEKTALVTGATNTISRAIVTAFAAEAQVLLSEAVAGSAAVGLTRAGAV
jgi:hypothetical protein